MANFIMLVILSALSAVAVLYVIHNILGSKPKLNLLNLVLFVCLSILISILYDTTSAFIRVLITFLLVAAISTSIYEEKINKTIVASFISFIVLTISEILVGLIYYVLTQKTGIEFNNDTFLNLKLNLGIFIITILLGNLKIVIHIGEKILDYTNRIKLSQTLLLAIVGILSAAMYLYFTYHKLSMVYLSIVNILIIFIYLFIVYNYFKQTNKNIKISNEYNVTKKSLKEYEEMYENQRMENHENKNQLYILRGMIEKDNKKALDYIDEITNNKDKENKEIMDRLKRVPTGGLRGILYNKIDTVKKKGYVINLQISKNLTIDDFNKIDDNLNTRICTIVAILMDNAIDAISKIKSKEIEKVVGIDIYGDNKKINISILNTFEGIIDFDKIDEKGYSSNGKGRGYGLSIIKGVVEEDKRIENDRQIIGNVFTQTIKIQIEK